MRDAVAPVPDLIRAELHAHLPDQYADELNASLDIKTITRPGGGSVATAAVQVYAQTSRDRKLKRLDRGLIAHPVFGNREVWRTQEGADKGMVPGWFTRTCQDAEPRVHAALERALKDVGDKAAG